MRSDKENEKFTLSLISVDKMSMVHCPSVFSFSYFANFSNNRSICCLSSNSCRCKIVF